MAAPTIQNLPADYWTDRKGKSPVAIVAHGTGGTDSRGTLQHGDGRGVSIHVLIDKRGVIYRMVPDEHGANHAGAPTSCLKLNGITYMGGTVNRVTLGFELENLQTGRDPYTSPQLFSMGWQINQWRARWGALPILRHAELDPTRRRDPYQLMTKDMEAWAVKAAAPPPPTFPTLYRAKTQALVFQAQSGQGALWGHLTIGEQVHVDKTYPEGTAHLLDGRGFVRLVDLEKVP